MLPFLRTGPTAVQVPDIQISRIPSSLMETAVQEAAEEVQKAFANLKRTYDYDILSGASKRYVYLNPVDELIGNLSFAAYVSIAASRRLSFFGGMGNENAWFDALNSTTLLKYCPPFLPEICPPTQYRSFSGYCNNILHPFWGTIYEPMQRILPPNYYDEHHQDSDIRNPINCCHRDAGNFECDALEVSPDDPFYRGYVRCLPRSRTLVLPRENCKLGSREQANLASSFLDASIIYGSTHQNADRIRLFSDGRYPLFLSLTHSLLYTSKLVRTPHLLILYRRSFLRELFKNKRMADLTPWCMLESVSHRNE
ncbi:unnamed protein product [Gongylonema pulchrum]|uniref:Lactoperoxidase n=1 Tax=Gongylonema pulchrum TaxID=637853 RepID=A0A183E5V2_9BILA|nr:unnamed protein product [Gongylonema pulchrum]